MDVQVVFLILLIAGLLLVGAEVFVPGGVLGVVGGLALIGAIIAGFSAYGPKVGVVLAFGIVFLMALAIYVWIKLFPKTPIGKEMTVATDLGEASAAESDLDALLGKEGVALSQLRPAGFARIDGKRVDVVTQGGMIDKEEPVRVVEIEGNRVVVKCV